MQMASPANRDSRRQGAIGRQSIGGKTPPATATLGNGFGPAAPARWRSPDHQCAEVLM
jgi:hypothetical protein